MSLTRTQRVAIAGIAVAAIIVIAAVLAAWTVPPVPHKDSNRVSMTAGPAFTFHAYQSAFGKPAWSAAANAMVTVTSILPSSLPSKPGLKNYTNSTNIEYQMIQGSTLTTGALSGSFNLTNWSTVSSQWPSFVKTITTNVSMWMDSTFQAFNNTTNVWDLYTYSDAISFNPRAPPTSFSASAFFDLAKPAATLPGLPPPSGTPSGSPGSAGNGSSGAGTSVNSLGHVIPAGINCGPNPVPKWKTNFDAYVTGPLPVMMANNTKRHSGGTPYADISDVLSGGSYKFDFTGAGGSLAYGAYSTTAGTSVTWGGTGSFSASGAAAAALPQASASFAIIYIDNVTLHAIRTTETLYYHTQPACAVLSFTVQRLTTTVVNMTDSSFNLKAGSWDSAYGELLTAMTHGVQKQIANVSTTSGNSQTWATMTGYATGYSNAQALQHTVTTVASFFLTTLDIGFGIMELAGICGAFCEAGGVTAALSVLGDFLGLMSALNAAMDSFAWTVSTSENLSASFITADNGGFSFQVLGITYPTNWQTAQGSVSVYIPDYIIGW